jgi:deoxyribodipyrimidine photo-lyase
VKEALGAAGIAFEEHGGDLLVPPEALARPKGGGYRVFTPFFRAWLTVQSVAPATRPERLTGPALPSDELTRILPEADPPIPAGPAAAAARLQAFIDAKDIDYYREERDLIADDTTSRLSPYLRFGMITSAQIGRALRVSDADDWGRDAFWRQIAWREFFHHLLWHRPEAATTALLPQYRELDWENDPAHLEAWTRGLTGYPLVDAAMRQLADTGWVHNRARMVAASFLVKDLHVDWRKGETVFMQGLIDGDPANNNGGWQWVASTGTDAAPYFRVMNPVKQARRHDPEGIYVKRYVPELRRVPLEHIHEPWLMDPEQQKRLGCRIGIEYPERIVDHVLRQREIVARYRAAAEHAERNE